MKKLLLLVLALGLLPAASAQTWCPPGATWTYDFVDMFERGDLVIRYQRDTLINGQTAQVLHRELRTVSYPGGIMGPPYRIPDLITRATADRVEVLGNGQFTTLYDFAALPGAS
ncbi:hypothetical protein [Hymenobacter koreensis]|uniref:Uncharacterized protein n=1 Tax=Hymenobacter koreensis TaxID=1084523 RepID=A0ABP8IYN1_9BACT